MQLRTLGGLALDGSALTRPKPLLVLAYLALEGPTPRRRLAELFFGDAADPRDSLASALRHLRTAGVLRDGRGADHAATDVPCDALAILRSFDAYRYEDVLAGYRGAFLDGITVALDVESEEWVFSTREAIAGRVRAAALHEARSAIAERRLDHARSIASLATTLVEASDLEQDELAVLLGVTEALGMPEVARLRALARGMDVDVLDASAGSMRLPSGGATLHRTTRFIGRVDERARIHEMLRDPAERVVVVGGLGGIGKTRLLMRVLDGIVHHHADRFVDPTIIVALDDVAEVSAAVSAIAAAAHLSAGAGASLESLVRSIAAQRSVLALDNVEHIDRVEEVILALVAACPQLFVIATSRRRLALQSAIHVELGGLRTESESGASEACVLFCDRAARAADLVFESDSDLREIDAICRLLDGHPLAVELAGAMTRVAGLGVLRETLETRLLELGGDAVEAPRRHHSVEALLAPTWERLDASDRRALVRLAAFRAAFTFEAVRETASLGLRRLTKLVDVAVVRSEGGGRGRYTLHPLVRAYVRERATPDEWTDARAAHLAYVSAFLEGVEADLERDTVAVLDRLVAVLEDVRAAVEYALEIGDDETAGSMLHMLVVSADLLQARGGDAGFVRLVVRVAATLQGSGDLGRAERLLTKAANATRTLLDDLEGSATLYEDALALAEHAGDTARRAALHSILAFVFLDIDPEKSTRHLTHAHVLAEAAGDPVATCEVGGRAMYCAARMGDWHTARRVGYDVLAMLDELDRTRATTRSRRDTMRYSCLHNLATAEDELGAKDLALQHRQRALAFAEERGHVLWQAYAHADLARQHHEAGAMDRGLAHFVEAARRFVEVGVREPLVALERDMNLVYRSGSHAGTSR